MKNHYIKYFLRVYLKYFPIKNHAPMWSNRNDRNRNTRNRNHVCDRNNNLKP